jgi:cell cycle sensor histidine kinase DivJ
MNWIDDWLAGLVHPACRANLAERSQHERFLLARTASVLGALVALPPYLLGRGLPTALEGLALIALATPLAALAALSRFGRLDLAQVLVSLALLPFTVVAVASCGGVASPAVLALAILPLDALVCGRPRAVLAAAAASLAGLPLALALQSSVIGPAENFTAVFLVGLTLGFGHALAQAVADRRLPALIGRARNAGEARESATLLAIDDLVTWHDRNGSVLRATSAATKLLGVPSSALQGRGLFDRIHVADRPAYLKAVSDAATSDEPIGVTLRLQIGTGDEGALGDGSGLARLPVRSWQKMLWVELRAHRFHAAEEESCAVVAVTRDVSLHLQRVEELESRSRRAERANESRAELLVSVSQEIRTPLEAIVGYAELMTGKETAARLGATRDYARLILDSGQHVLGVVSTLLDLATIDAGAYDLAPEPLDVAELVGDGCRSVALAAERAGVALARDVAAHFPELRADRRACQQILLGLLSNAITFTPRGGLVTIQARSDGDRITLTVRDTGIGVSPSELPQIAEPFYRATASRRCTERGNGLDFTVVRSLVALQGGRLDVASTAGAGLAVTVSLPVEAGGRHRAPMPALIRSRPGHANRALAINAV